MALMIDPSEGESEKMGHVFPPPPSRLSGKIIVPLGPSNNFLDLPLRNKQAQQIEDDPKFWHLNLPGNIWPSLFQCRKNYITSNNVKSAVKPWFVWRLYIQGTVQIYRYMQMYTLHILYTVD